MARGVHNSAVVLVLATIAYENSPNCKKECQLAVSKRIPVVKLHLDKEIKDSLNWLSAAIVAGDLWYVKCTLLVPFSNEQLK